MSVICPTVLAADPHSFREQIKRVAPLADRIQIDLMDGLFTPTKSINPVQVWWPETIRADLHVMFKHPLEHLETLISLKPHMIILHAESEGNIGALCAHIKKFNIEVGIALLASSQPETYKDIIQAVDHVLLFSGSLGSFGGTADLTLLNKVADIKTIHPGIEIGWDGGANENNIARLAAGGVAVINVGGAIQRADNPQNAYDTLVAKLTTT